MRHFDSTPVADFSQESAEKIHYSVQFANSPITFRDLAAEGWSFDDLEIVFT